MVRPARPRSYLDFEKYKTAAAAAAHRHYRGLAWLGRARRAGGAPVHSIWSYKDQDNFSNTTTVPYFLANFEC